MWQLRGLLEERLSGLSRETIGKMEMRIAPHRSGEGEPFPEITNTGIPRFPRRLSHETGSFDPVIRNFKGTTSPPRNALAELPLF